MRPALLAGLLGVAVAAGIMLLALPSDLFGRVPPLAGTMTAQPAQVAVVDGETLVLRETIVKLRGVSAPARGQSCRDRSGRDSDCGAVSADALAALVHGHPVACQLDGRDAKGFARGFCEAADVDLSRALVVAGWVRANPGAPDLVAAEAEARLAGRGLWGSGAL